MDDICSYISTLVILNQIFFLKLRIKVFNLHYHNGLLGVIEKCLLFTKIWLNWWLQLVTEGLGLGGGAAVGNWSRCSQKEQFSYAIS
jgi:hypothetical protein